MTKKDHTKEANRFADNFITAHELKNGPMPTTIKKLIRTITLRSYKKVHKLSNV